MGLMSRLLPHFFTHSLSSFTRLYAYEQHKYENIFTCLINSPRNLIINVCSVLFHIFARRIPPYQYLIDIKENLFLPCALRTKMINCCFYWDFKGRKVIKEIPSSFVLFNNLKSLNFHPTLMLLNSCIFTCRSQKNIKELCSRPTLKTWKTAVKN